MSGALRNEKILSAILRVTTRPVSHPFAHVQRPKVIQTITAATPWRAASGFSVSFGPDPEDHAPKKASAEPLKSKRKGEHKENETQRQSVRKAKSKRKEEHKETKTQRQPAHKAKSKRKKEHKQKETQRQPALKAKSKKQQANKAEPAQGVKPQQKQHSPVHGGDVTPRHASAVAILGNSSTSLQNQETTVHARQAENNATGETSVADSSYCKPAEQELEDELSITDHLTTESCDPKEHSRAALRGGEEPANTPHSDSQSAATRKPKRKEAKDNQATDIIIGSESVLDEQASKPHAPVDPAHTANLSPAKEATKGKQGSPAPRSSSAEPGTPPSRARELIRTDSRGDLKSKPDEQTNPPKPLPAKKEPWQIQKQALKKKFGSENWNPRKKLSPDTIDGIRALHEQYPDKYPTPVLAEKFKVSPEAIRRILKSKWRPDPEKQAERRERWARRHDRIWDQQAAIGLRPARTKAKKAGEPGDLAETADIEEFNLVRAQKQARDTYQAAES
jgi:hypothetical protein